MNNWPSSPNPDIAQQLRNLQINAPSPLTTSLINQHNMMTNLQVPGQHLMIPRKLNQNSSNSFSDMHSSGYHSSFNDNSMMDRNMSGKPSMSSSSGAQGSGSRNSSPESSMSFGTKQMQHPPTINYADSPPYKYAEQMRNANGRKV